jgi:hypothetical protein
MEQVGIIARRECGGCQGMERVEIIRRRRWSCQDMDQVGIIARRECGGLSRYGAGRNCQEEKMELSRYGGQVGITQEKNIKLSIYGKGKNYNRRRRRSCQGICRAGKNCQEEKMELSRYGGQVGITTEEECG